MSLIDEQTVSATRYKKARCIMFDNSIVPPALRIYEDDVILMGEKTFSNHSGEYTVPYSPKIEIPLPDEVLTLLGNIKNTKMLPIDALMGILLAVYAFGRVYQSPVIQPSGSI